MNDKKAKALRRKARMETVGLPERQLVRSHQATNNTSYAECAVNNPNSTRGFYRALKSGRVMGTKAIESAAKYHERREIEKQLAAQQQEVPATAYTQSAKPKVNPGVIDRFKQKASQWFRRFATA